MSPRWDREREFYSMGIETIASESNKYGLPCQIIIIKQDKNRTCLFSVVDLSYVTAVTKPCAAVTKESQN